MGVGWFGEFGKFRGICHFERSEKSINSLIHKVKIFVYIIRYSFLASRTFVFDEIFGVWFFKKQEFCHFEPFVKRRKIHRILDTL